MARQRVELAVDRVGDVDERRRRRSPSSGTSRRPSTARSLRRAAPGGRTGCARRGTPRPAWRHRPPGDRGGWRRCAAKLRSGDWRDDALRAHPADDAADVAAQVEGRLEAAVGMTEEGDVGDADHLRRRPLLGLADLDHRGARHGAVEATRLAAGADAVGDLDPRVGPAGDDACGSEVDVVGVRGDDQDPFDSRRLQAIGRNYRAPTASVDAGLRAGSSPTPRGRHPGAAAPLRHRPAGSRREEVVGVRVDDEPTTGVELLVELRRPPPRVAREDPHRFEVGRCTSCGVAAEVDGARRDRSAAASRVGVPRAKCTLRPSQPDHRLVLLHRTTHERDGRARPRRRPVVEHLVDARVGRAG